MLFLSRSFFRVFRMSTQKNPYTTLGLNRNASMDDIKKAYRAIAQKYHPDKNSDPSARIVFIEAKIAYETLGDEDKRRQYDNEKYPNERDKESMRDPFQEFNDGVFRDRTRVHHETFSSGATRGAKKRKGDNIVCAVNVGFVEAIKGCKRSISLSRKAACVRCHGNRCEPGSAPSRCLHCGGAGTCVERKSLQHTVHVECLRCSGTGIIFKDPCIKCHGKGLNKQDFMEEVEIPAGIHDGMSITLTEKGHQSYNGPNGDMIIEVKVEQHPRFRQSGNDILSVEWVTVSQAALGYQKKIDTIWGQTLLIIPPGTQDNTRLTIRGEGVDMGRSKGLHLALIRVKIPVNLTEDQRRIFKELSEHEEEVDQKAKFENPPPEEEYGQTKTYRGDDLFQTLKKAFK